jgi:hypothetical protein
MNKPEIIPGLDYVPGGTLVFDGEDTSEDTLFQQSILVGLNNLGKHIYTGTVPENVKAKRRAKNKQSRISRRKNRA